MSESGPRCGDQDEQQNRFIVDASKLSLHAVRMLDIQSNGFHELGKLFLLVMRRDSLTETRDVNIRIAKF